MAGLLSDVLPYLYSQGDRAKRYMNGLLSDPVGSAQQTAGLLGDKHREMQALQAQAFPDQSRPFKVGDSKAMGQMADAMLAGPLSFAPAGITVWHGSPHKFSKFDHQSNLGQGDGFQAQGVGTYLAEAPEVGKTYAKQNGNLYKVDLPDDMLKSMLNFGAPLKEQRHLGDFLNPILEKHPDLKDSWFGAVRNGENGEYLFYSMMQKFARELKQQGVPANKIHQQANQMATNTFRDAGLTGFKYPDAMSKGNPGGTSNYVVFDDSALSILERNGQPIR